MPNQDTPKPLTSPSPTGFNPLQIAYSIALPIATKAAYDAAITALQSEFAKNAFSQAMDFGKYLWGNSPSLSLPAAQAQELTKKGLVKESKEYQKLNNKLLVDADNLKEMVLNQQKTPLEASRQLESPKQRFSEINTQHSTKPDEALSQKNPAHNIPQSTLDQMDLALKNFKKIPPKEIKKYFQSYPFDSGEINPSNGDPVVMNQIKIGNLNIIKYIVKNHPEVINQLSSAGENMLEVAIREKQLGIAAYLRKNYPRLASKKKWN